MRCGFSADRLRSQIQLPGHLGETWPNGTRQEHTFDPLPDFTSNRACSAKKRSTSTFVIASAAGSLWQQSRCNKGHRPYSICCADRSLVALAAVDLHRTAPVGATQLVHDLHAAGLRLLGIWPSCQEGRLQLHDVPMRGLRCALLCVHMQLRPGLLLPEGTA